MIAATPTGDADWRDRVDRFLNAIEGTKSALEHKYQIEFHGIGEAVRHAVKHKHRAVMGNQTALKILVELRNAIQHSHYKEGQPLAVPRDDAVVAMEELRALITDAPRVSHFMTKSPRIVQPSTPLDRVLEIVIDEELSQFPVCTDEEYLGLLTTNSIARWLADAFRRSKGDLLEEGPLVADALAFTESQDAAKFCSPTAGALDISTRLSGPDAPAAYLITADGKSAPNIQGIVTRYDVPRILKAHTVNFFGP